MYGQWDTSDYVMAIIGTIMALFLVFVIAVACVSWGTGTEMLERGDCKGYEFKYPGAEGIIAAQQCESLKILNSKPAHEEKETRM